MRATGFAVVLLVTGCAATKSDDGPILGRAMQRSVEVAILSDEIVIAPQGVESTPSYDSVPDVALGGGTYVVVRSSGQPPMPVKAFRVDGSGALLDPSGIAVSADGVSASAAFLGSQFLVAFSTSNDTRASWLSAGGTVSPMTAPLLNFRTENTRLVAGSNGFALGYSVMGSGAWGEYSVARFDSAGTELGRTFLGNLPPLDRLALAHAAGVYWAVWRRCDPSPIGCFPTLLDIARVRESDGSLVDSGVVEISSGGLSFYGPSIACTADTCLLGWSDWDNTCGGSATARAQRFDATTGMTLDAEPLVLGTGRVVGDTAATTTDVDFLVAFGVDSTMSSLHVPTRGTFGPSAQAPFAGISAGDPALASNGANAVAVWIESRGAALRTTSARFLGTDGAPLISFELSAGDGLVDQRSPAVATDGVSYLVAWRERRGRAYQIVAARLDAAGNVLGAPIEMPRRFESGLADYDSPRVVFDGSNYVVSWLDGFGGGWQRLLLARVDANGNLLDSEPSVLSAAEQQVYHHALTTVGGAVEAYWTAPRCTLYSATEAVGRATLDGSGNIATATLQNMAGTVPLGVFAASNGAAELVIHTGQRDEFFTYFGDPTNGLTAFPVSACQFSHKGVESIVGVPGGFVVSTNVSPFLTLCSPPATSSEPIRASDTVRAGASLAYDGERLYALQWRSDAAPTHEIVLLDPDATSVGPAVSIPGRLDATAIASRAAGEALVVYETFDTPSGYTAVRARVLGVHAAPERDAGVIRDASVVTSDATTGTPDAALRDGSEPDVRQLDARRARDSASDASASTEARAPQREASGPTNGPGRDSSTGAVTDSAMSGTPGEAGATSPTHHDEPDGSAKRQVDVASRVTGGCACRLENVRRDRGALWPSMALGLFMARRRRVASHKRRIRSRVR